MPKVEYENVIYDSQGELDFKHWLDEAYSAGLITSYSKQEKGIDTIELIGKQHYHVNGKNKHCFASVDYTPDFLIVSNLFTPFCDKNLEQSHHYIDVKGGFSQHSDNKQFQIIRKMMFKFKGIYVHKVVPEELFLKTWVPELCLYTKVKRDIQKKYLDALSVGEYLKKRQQEEEIRT